MQAPFPRKWRHKYTRGKDGCLTCRRRRKRCDLQQPTCFACDRNGLECYWPEPKPTLPVQPELTCTELTRQCKDLTATKDVAQMPSSAINQHLRSCETSLMLFEHYTRRTGHILGTRPAAQNVFLTSALAMAASDGLILQAIVAVSGSHVLGDPTKEAAYAPAVTRHYCMALEQLRSAIESANIEEDWLRIGVALVFICHYEAISGDFCGLIFMHLRAMWQILPKLKHRIANQDPLARLVLEAYGYLTTVNRIVPHCSLQGRILPTLTSDFVAWTMFGPASTGTFWDKDLLICRFIGPVSKLAGDAQHCHDSADVAAIVDKAALISASLAREARKIKCIEDSLHEVYRQALLVWLNALSRVDTMHTPALAHVLQRHLELFWPHFQDVARSKYATVLLWPTAIVGSCMLSAEDQHQLGEMLSNGWQITQVRRLGKLLQLLWEDDNPQSFGPSGLAYIMKKHDLNFCMA